MRSAGAPTATVLTVMTLIFAPVVKHGHTTQQLVARDTSTVTVSCSSAVVKCPKQARMHERVNALDSSPRAISAAVSEGVAQAIADFQAAHPSERAPGANLQSFVR
jgi:hypothetical protein